jgi:hypothetical protein
MGTHQSLTLLGPGIDHILRLDPQAAATLPGLRIGVGQLLDALEEVPPVCVVDPGF